MTDASESGALMDRIYRRQRHIYDATRKYYLLGRDHLIAELRPPPGGAVLEIGCGTARNLIRAARAYPDARFYGIDISAGMLETAQAEIERAGLSGRIRLERADAGAFHPAALFGFGTFDRCFFSYSLSMIPPWRGAIERVLEATRPGIGRLHVVDFGQQEGLPDRFRGMLFAWLRRFHVEPRADLREALAAAARAQGGQLAFTPLYRGYAWYAEISEVARTS